MVATYMVQNYLQDDAYLTRSLVDIGHQRIAVLVLQQMLNNLQSLVYMGNYGIRHQGPDGTEWVRPAPAEVIAMMLGVGPPNNPALGGWDGN